MHQEEKRRGLIIALASNQRVLEVTGGIESYTKTLCNALTGMGHKPFIVCRTLSKTVPIVVSECESRKVESTIHKRGKGGKGTVSLYFVQLVVFTLFLFMHLLRRARSGELDIIHAQEVYFSGLASALLARATNRSAVVHCHGYNELPTRNKAANLGWFVHRVVFLMTLKLCHSIIATDPITAKVLMLEGVHPSKITILPSFLDYERFPTGYANTSKPDEIATYVIGYVGRLTEIKRVDILIETTSFLRNRGINVETIIVGDGHLRTKLSSLAEKLGVIAHVHFLGERLDVRPFLSRMDVFVLPSESEGSPVAVLEAMSFGLPLVVSDIPSLRCLLTDNEAKFFAVGSSRSLSAILVALLPDKEERHRMKVSVLKGIDRYSVSRTAHKVVRVYLDSMKKRCENVN